MGKIPKFKNEAEEAAFWDTHDTTLLGDEIKEITNMQFPQPAHKSIVISIEDRYINAIKKIAHKRHIPFHTLIQRWVKEKALGSRA